MYKVLIVDDERMIRLGMQKAIPWQTMDVSEIHVAKSGEEALTKTTH
jgi:two-component system response regulator YesN